MRLLRYFSKIIQAHTNSDYSNLFEPIANFGDENDSFSNEFVQKIFQPRGEFFGANILSFRSFDGSLV